MKTGRLVGFSKGAIGSQKLISEGQEAVGGKELFNRLKLNFE